jgi:hypothetical protein
MIASNQVTFKFQVASERKISNANLFIRGLGWRGFAKHVLKNIGGFDYVAADTVKLPQSGKIEYCVAVEASDGAFTFPEGVHNTPGKWDFSPNGLWSTKVIAPDEAIALIDVRRDRRDFVFPHYSRSMRYIVDYTNGSSSEEEALSLKVSFLEEKRTPFGLQLGVSDLVKSVAGHLDKYRHLVLNARSTQDSTCTIGIVLLMADGRSYGVDAEIKNTWQGIEIPLSAFRSRSALILPDSYPHFLPKEWKIEPSTNNDRPDLNLLQSVQITVDPTNVRRQSEKREIGFSITSVNLK